MILEKKERFKYTINYKLIVINYMETTLIQRKILKMLAKDFRARHSVTSLAKEIGMSRVGIWKVLKKMQLNKLVILSPVGSGKTSIYIADLNWENFLALKNLEFALAEDAFSYKKWLSIFSELKDKTEFLILYGSILHSSNEANDIDILGIANKDKFIELDKAVNKIQKTSIKKIHALNFTPNELKKELTKPNKVFIDAIKKGIILFGQEEFINFIKEVKQK